MKILVVELWNIGDVILTLPFLAQLRAKFPGATVSFLGQPHARDLLQGTDLVDEFIETRLTWKREEGKWFRVPLDALELTRAVRAIRRERFDIAFQSRSH